MHTPAPDTCRPLLLTPAACAAAVPVTPAGTARGVRAATSIVMSGIYEDDVDTPSDIIAFTGAARCDAVVRCLSRLLHCGASWRTSF